MDVVGLGALTLDTGTIHGSDAAQLVVRVTPAAQTRLEAVFKLLADKVEDNGVYAGVDCYKVDTEVIQDQQEIEQLTALSIFWPVKHLLQDPAEVQWKPAQGEDEDEAEHGFGHLPPLFEVLTEGNAKAAVPVVEHLAGHQSVEHSGAEQRYTKVEAKQPPVLCFRIEHHEVRLWVKHAGAHGFILVGEGDHVENNSLRYCQDERQPPNSYNLHDCKQRDAHSLNSAPGCHSSVPVHAEGTQVENSDAHRGFLQEGEQLTQTQANNTVVKRKA